MRKNRLPYWEFIILVSIMFGMIAFGTDTMLPAFPDIAKDLELLNVNKAQLIISSFILGTGLGQLISGPISDTFGRKPIITIGLMIFILACIAAYYAETLEMMLVARFIQGLGISAPRTVTMALIRDLYSGRKMAQVMSLAMAIFVLVPALAPSIGQLLFINFGWRSIYMAFIAFALIGLLWLNLRQPETLPFEQRKKLSSTEFLSAFKVVITNTAVVKYTVTLALGFGALFGYLNSAQQIFVDTLGAGMKFPMYFAIISILAAPASFMNAALVMKYGMKLLATIGFALQIIFAIITILIINQDFISMEWLLVIFISWSVIAFFLKGLYFGNLNALAMEPMGEIAGMASAIIGASATMLGILIAIPIGLAFNGTATPVLFGYITCSSLALILMLTKSNNN
ncbi:MAG: multidrug effflux MFS transporter [Rhodobacterales bacterium]|jgi:DHA1 family bicyclomycin/chloramphenicol resistance-like MFS transporter|tara:strand:+ start:4440 stop:5639 length:1200 start_codon:yes stop_codon:yes gene_type:complete